MKRKGAGNVEFILAFVLFSGFTITALYLFNPFVNTTSLTSTRDYVEGAIISNSSVELESYSVIITGGNDVMIDFPKVSQNKGVVVLNYSDNLTNSQRDSLGRVCFTKQSSEKFFMVSFSEDIVGGTKPTCTGSASYRLGSSVSDKLLSEKRILQIKNSYYSDYSALKQQLDIPPNVDFAFSFKFKDGQVIEGTRSIPLRTDVFANTKIEEILRTNGKSEFGYLTVSVW